MRPENVQREYYAETAHDYDDRHTNAPDEHTVALERAVEYMRVHGVTSVLDTGCGTGRTLRHVQARLPHVSVRGNDPSQELLRVAVERHGIPAEWLDCVGSESLPYPDGSFDAVVATGILHHVPDPQRVVREMLRVARIAVFISDSNIYGQGSFVARAAKLALSRLALLKTINRMRRGGHDWYFTPEDGLAYSYSVFDSLRLIQSVCAEVAVHATTHGSPRRRLAILREPHCLVVGIKDNAHRAEGER